MKNVVKCYKHFFGYFNALKTHCVHHVLNLRFLPQEIKKITINFANMWRFITNHIDTPTERKTAGGPKTICPICTIPVIGIKNYLKQNFRNMTNATKMAASNFSTKQLITTTLSNTLKLTRVTLELLINPFKKMKIGRLNIRLSLIHISEPTRPY